MKEHEPKPNNDDLPKDVIQKRIDWDNKMINLLLERRKLVVEELVRLDGQIEGIKADRVNLFELLVKG